MFRRLGVPVFDADAEVHRLQGPGGALLPAIEAAFPGSTGAAGMNRDHLRQLVMADRTALPRLEAIVHPAVRAVRVRFLKRHRARRLVLIDIPLLYETHAERELEAVAVVSASLAAQRRRVLARPGMTHARFRAILARQLPDHEKRRRADFVIPTGTTRHATATHVRRLVACLRAHGVRYCASCGKSSSTPKPRG